MGNKGLCCGVNLKPTTPFILECIPHRKKSNNWLKMHHKPMRRKPLKKPSANLVVIGKMGCGRSFTDKMKLLHGEEYKRLNIEDKFFRLQSMMG